MSTRTVLYQRILLVVLVFGLYACGKKDRAATNVVKEFAVVTLQPTSVEMNSSYPATIRGLQDVEIRPKVSGFISRLCVDEGAMVHKGQALFIIDPVQYEATVRSMAAAVKMAEVNLSTSKLTVENKTKLAEKNIISAYDLQLAQNDLLSKEATLAQGNAQLDNARKDLAYTTITSPSDGVVGTIPFRIGSLVSSTTAMPLTTVSDISNMYIYFSMNEKQLLILTRQGGTMKEILNNMPNVQLVLADGTTYADSGKIETLSGVIDSSTGSVTVRALFPNKRNVLRSGGTGNILLPVKVDSAFIVPQKATYELQNKKYIYVMDADGTTVVSTEIEVLPLNNGENYIVTSGLHAGNRIVTEGVLSIRPGMKIKPLESATKAN